MKKQVAKKELVEFYDNIEVEHKSQLKSIVKSFKGNNSYANSKITEEASKQHDLMDENINNIKKNSKKGAKKLEKKVHFEKKMDIVETNLLNLDDPYENDDDIDMDEENRLMGGINDDNEQMDQEGQDGDMDMEDSDMGDDDDSDSVDLDKVQKKMSKINTTANTNGESQVKAPIIKDKAGAEAHYNSQKYMKDDKREALKEKLKEKLRIQKEETMAQQYDPGLLNDTDDARVINRNMARNKGFTRKRKAEDYNPRVKRKIKYKKAQYKRIVSF